MHLLIFTDLQNYLDNYTAIYQTIIAISFYYSIFSAGTFSVRYCCSDAAACNASNERRKLSWKNVNFKAQQTRQRYECILDLLEIVDLQLLIVCKSSALVDKDERKEDCD